MRALPSQPCRRRCFGRPSPEELVQRRPPQRGRRPKPPAVRAARRTRSQPWIAVGRSRSRAGVGLHGAERRPSRGRGLRRPSVVGLALAAEAPGAVGRQRLDDQAQRAALEPGVGADGGAAGAFQGLSAPRSAATASAVGRVAQGLPARPRRVRGAGLDGQRALARRRRALDRIDQARRQLAAGPAGSGPPAASRMASASPASSLARRVSTLPRSIDDFAGRAGGAAPGPGGAGWRCRAARPAAGRRGCSRLAADEGVARILALGDGGDDQARRQLGRHVLQRMDGAVDAAVQQGLLDLLGEQALAADLQQPRGPGCGRRWW